MELSKYLTIEEAIKKLEAERELLIYDDTYPNRQYSGDGNDRKIVALDSALEVFRRVIVMFGTTDPITGIDCFVCSAYPTFITDEEKIKELRDIIEGYKSDICPYDDNFGYSENEKMIEALLMGIKILEISSLMRKHEKLMLLDMKNMLARNNRDIFFEDEKKYDIEVFDETYNEYLESGKKSRPINKLWDELNI